jgi:hypothetical protein
MEVGYEDVGWIILAQSKDKWLILATLAIFELKKGRTLSRPVLFSYK